ncbi:MAG: bifunctional riboflavin kinase/FAD synthetase [Desulfobacteraceae bacterium]|nr:MAG: bifunctional riboflavin kinase/FAD synthetase [Desulfobacteraceae bacterium]
MNVITDLSTIEQPFTRPVVTIGNFDGVHKGHQAIFHQVIEKAESIKGTSVAMTFEPHPMRVLKKKKSPPLITLYEQKKELIAKTGIDVFICIPFDKDFAAITARRFIEDILVKTIGLSAIVIGNDYSFGKDRKGNVAFLRQHADRFGYEVIVADWIPGSLKTADRISSTRIRETVMAGKVDEVAQLLGRYYQIRGKVVSGRNRGGRLLGFPTANINLIDELCPKAGVYAVTVECQDKKYQGVANIGYSPTFDDHIFTVEVHLLDFSGDLYDQDIRVNFIQRIRNEKKFGGLDELSAQITKDIQTARDILSGNPS